jgi:hypothetical protein
MEWTKQIVATFLAIELLALSVVVATQIPLRDTVGRIALFIWVAMILTFCIAVALFYDQNIDTFKWSNIYGKISSKKEMC